jgi:hypothetical protein
MNTDIKNFELDNQCGADELTKRDIAKLLGVTPQRVTQYKFLPRPTRRDEGQGGRGRTVYYNKAAVMEAIHKQYPDFGKPRSTMVDRCKKAVKKSLALQFLAGRFDDEERRREYDSLKYWAQTHPVVTKRVRIKGEINMRGSE